MSIKKELGEKIRRIRKNRNLTQEQLAEMIDITPRNLSGIEVGVNFVKADTLEKILKALDITAEELFANDNLKETPVLVDEIISRVKTIQGDRQRLERVWRVVKFLCAE